MRGAGDITATLPPLGSLSLAEVRLPDGEVVRLKRRHPDIVVQAIGGALPPWATPSPVLSERPDFEVVIIRDAHLVSDPDRQCGTGRLNLFWAKHRFAVVEAGAADLWLPGHQLQVRAARGDLELVAEALIQVVAGELFLAVDATDLLELAGAGARNTPTRYAPGSLSGSDHGPSALRSARDGRPSSAGRGSAVVIDGIAEETMAPHPCAWRDVLEREGFGASMFVMQLLGPGDLDAFSLQRFDAFLAALMRPSSVSAWGATAAVNATRSAVVLFGFRADPN